MLTKKVIIWDFDGPIVDSRELALELTQYQYHNITEELHRNLFNGNIFEELSKLNKKDFTEEEYTNFIEKSYRPRKVKLLPVAGIPELLKKLGSNFTMFINSSAPGSQIYSYLENHNLSSLFKKVYGSEIKSKVEKFQIIFSDFQVSHEECLLVTDTLGDVIDAEQVGVSSIVVLWGYQRNDHFKPVEGKVTFVENPIELEKAIETISSK